MKALFANAPLMETLRRQFAIDWLGHHGVAHWSRVRLNGIELACDTDADLHVIELFALFHDSQRLNEYEDEGHGARGFTLATRLRGQFFEASDQQMDLLERACSLHSDGESDSPLTVQFCWDADRLDLLRVGIEPRAKYLCTAQARRPEQMERSNRRALAWRENFHQAHMDD